MDAFGFGVASVIIQMMQQDRDQVVRQAKQAAGPNAIQMRYGRFYGRADPSGPAGNGVFEFVNGDVYVGSFIKGNMNGQGTIRD